MFVLDKNVLSRLNYFFFNYEIKYNYDMSSIKTDMVKTIFHKHLFLSFTYLITKNVIWAGKS